MGKRALLFSVALSAAFLGGCGGGGGSSAVSVPTPTSGAAPIPAALGEATAGRWQPILVAAESVADVGAPPSSGVPPERAEIEQLLALQNARTTDQNASVGFWNAGASLRWNAIARDLVISHDTPPPACRALLRLSFHRTI